MIKNYLITAKRAILKKSVFSALNVIGLSIGIASAGLIFHYISYEKSFDNYHPNSKNIYRLTYGRLKEDCDNIEFASACPVIAPLLKDNFPEIQHIARLAVREAVFSNKENKFIEERIYHAEQEIFNILEFKVLKGSIENTLNQPNKILVNRSTAEKYFGDTNPIGKFLKLNNLDDYEVVAVFEDVPQNSHFKPDILMSFQNIMDWRRKDYLDLWGYTGAYTYLALDSDAKPRQLEKRFIEFTKAQIPELLKKHKNILYFNLQAIEDIHLSSHLLQEHEENGNESLVNFMYIIGAFILIIAWVNYINLTTSQSMERAHEVGIRKVVGAIRKNLASQFYLESAIINFIGIILAIISIVLIAPFYKELTGAPINFYILYQPWFILFLVFTFLFGTFIAGMYPVFALTSFSPVKILSGRFSLSTKGIGLRKVMIIIQFAISILLITGTYTVNRQLHFLLNQDLGFDKDQTLVITIPRVLDSTFIQRKETFKQEVVKYSGVEGAAFSTEVPGRKIWWDNGDIYKVGLDISDAKNYMIMGVDDQFINLYQMEFVVGRNFIREFQSDTDALIINETAVKHLEFKNPEDALNNKVIYWEKTYTVIGILKDYSHESPKVLPEPQIFRYLPNENRFGAFSIKLTKETTTENLKNIEKEWSKLFPGNPFNYFFLDTYYDEQFNSDRKFGKVFGVFSGLAIFITCLGLFGLSLYSTQLKTKEIGIRKVHGASFLDIIKYILTEYIVLLVIALVITLPITFWGILFWLNNFSVKMSISIWLFIIPVLIVFLITFISVFSHTLKAARLNPVDTIKYE